MSSEQGKVVLGYWKIRGLASQLRYQLVYSNIPFEEVVYDAGPPPENDRSMWLDKKFTLGMPFPNLPYIFDGEFKLSETLAIHQYLADKYDPKLLGSTPEERAEVNMLANIAAITKSAVSNRCYAADANKEEIAELALSKLPQLVEYLADKPFLTGKNVTYPDFIFLELIDVYNWITDGEATKKFPTLQAYFDRVTALPRLKEFWASDKCIKRPFNNPQATLNN